MSEKKRKSHATESERPSKKQQTTSNVTVKHVANSSAVKPIIVTSPGVTFPSNISFQTFSKKTQAGRTLLLHSSEHPTIDYTASEGDNAIETHLKHYVAVFDPATGGLQLTEAKRLTLRSSVRTTQAAKDNEEDVITPVTNYSSRTALTQAFGTKKSKKAVQSMAENRLLAQGSEEANNPISSAILSNVSDDDLNVVASEAAARANKPLPLANINTNEIAEVYSYDTLIHPSPFNTTLEMMPTNSWVARISAKKDVLTRSRFVASRVAYLVKHLLDTPEASDPNLIRSLQVLRYIQLLVETHNYIRTLPRKRRIPRTDEWPETVFSEETPTSLVTPIIAHFFPGDRTPTTHALTLLRTTILALTLHIPPPSLNPGSNLLVTDPTDISLDMAIESLEMKKLYRELGCKVEPARDGELERWGLEKLSKRRKDEDGKVIGKKPDFARLRLPLVFPKISRGRSQARR